MPEPANRIRSALTSARTRLAAAWTNGRTRVGASYAKTRDNLKSRDWRLKRPSKAAMIWMGSIAGVIVVLLVGVALLDWNYLKGPVERIASNRAGRPIKITGDLDVELLRWNPVAVVQGLQIANPDWAGGGNMTEIEQLTVSVKLKSLFGGETVLPLVRADKPNIKLIRTADGKNNWTFKGKSPGEPTRLPAIRRFEIIEGKLRIDDDQRELIFNGTVSSSEVVDERRVEGFKLLGDGTLNREPFDLILTGGPLLNVDPDRPYPFDATVNAGPTRATAKGQILRPFDLGKFHANLTLRGPDLARLYNMTGITLPNTPPYNVSGRLVRRDLVYDFTGIDGTIGDSDMRGNLTIETGRPRLYMKANLSSNVLDFDDLATVLGGAPSTEAGESASGEQKQIAAKMVATQKLFPDAKLDVKRLRTMDADVNYRAETIRTRNFPVRRGSMILDLDNGVMTLDPLSFGLTHGQLAGRVVVNAQKDMPHTSLDMRMTGARVESFVPARFGNAIEGGLIGRAKLSGSGRSVHEFASNADGQVTAVIPRGEIREAFAELMGVNVLRGLGLLWSEDKGQTELRCAVADFRATDGTLVAQRLIVDTDPVLAQGKGVINLETERMDLELQGKPKEFRLIRLMMPITVEGPLKRPKVGVEAGGAIAQAGIGLALASALGGLSALLPFVGPGLADDANCQALINQAGGPVRTPMPTAQDLREMPRDQRRAYEQQQRDRERAEREAKDDAEDAARRRARAEREAKDDAERAARRAKREAEQKARETRAVSGTARPG